MKTKLLCTALYILFVYHAIAQPAVNNTAACPALTGFLAKNLVAYYPFCGNANDQSGNGNHPSVVTAQLTEDRFGNASSAYAFNGSTDQYIKGSCSNYPANARTVSIWFKEKNLTNPNNEIMGYGGGACGTSFFISFNESNHPGMYTVTGHCEANNCSTPNQYPPSKTWHNFIVTTGNGQTKFYLDGNLIDSFANNFSATDVAGKDFGFGTIPGTNGEAPYVDPNVFPMKGSLDDIVIYSKVFNAKQVKKLYKFFKDAPVISDADKTVAVSPKNIQSKIQISPNPSKGIIHVACNSAIKTITNFNVYDAAGKLLFSKKEEDKPGAHHTLDLSFLNKGIYFLEVNNGNGLPQRVSFIMDK